MRQLGGVDVSFLNMESPTTFGHISSLSLYEADGVPGGAGAEATKRAILEHVDLLSPFRQRLVEVPLGLDLPYWVDDPHFDIDEHVSVHTVSAPGSPEQLAELVARLVAEPLSRTRPLWELHVINGVDRGATVAQLIKVHHAALDGAAGALLMAAFLSTDPEHRPAARQARPAAPPLPSAAGLLARTAGHFLRQPERVARLTARTLRGIAANARSGSVAALADLVAQPIPGPLGELMRRRLRPTSDAHHLPALPPTAAPRAPWNAAISARRAFAFTSVPLEEVREVRRAVGCTLNDVVLALCSATLRGYLEAHDCLPDAPLVAMVPVSVRTGAEADPFQNRVSAVFTDLATDEADPVRRLARLSGAMHTAKEHFAAIPAEELQDFVAFAPPAIAARVLRLASRLHLADHVGPPFNLVISNVPGPQQSLYSAGARLAHYYPVSTIVDGQGLNITVQSYDGSLDVGLLACADLVPDLWSMTERFQQAHAELRAAVLRRG